MGDLSTHFDRSEFACKCGCGIANVSLALVGQLERLRQEYGKPITINSGCRCPAHNAAVGGVPDSAHVCTAEKQGEAADIRVANGGEAYALLDHILFMKLFSRIGVGKTLLHLDVDQTKPQNTVWVYSDK